MRPHLRKWLRRGLVLAVVLVAADYAARLPLLQYQPLCGSGDRTTTLEGELRREFADEVEKVLRFHDFRYRRVGNEILVPLLFAPPLRGPDGRPHPEFTENLGDIQVNTEPQTAWKLARRLVPPPSLARELQRVAAEIGPMPPPFVRGMDTDTEDRQAWDERFRSGCALLRAAFLVDPARRD